MTERAKPQQESSQVTPLGKQHQEVWGRPCAALNNRNRTNLVEQGDTGGGGPPHGEIPASLPLLHDPSRSFQPSSSP